MHTGTPALRALAIIVVQPVAALLLPTGRTPLPLAEFADVEIFLVEPVAELLSLPKQALVTDVDEIVVADRPAGARQHEAGALGAEGIEHCAQGGVLAVGQLREQFAHRLRPAYVAAFAALDQRQQHLVGDATLLGAQRVRDSGGMVVDGIGKHRAGRWPGAALDCADLALAR